MIISFSFLKAKAEKMGNDRRVVELDHLVGQLLSINEALVRQLGGDRVTHRTC